MKRAVLVICDGLRADMVKPELAPNICGLAEQSTRFANHRGVFPSTTRTTSASIATGCLPGRHGLEGNCVALDEGNGLVAVSVAPVEFRDRLEKATGRTLRVPTLAERLRNDGGSVVFSNVSAGAGIFQDPDGHGWIYHRSFSYRPDRVPVPPAEALNITHDAAGDTAMTERFAIDVLERSRPALAVLWQCEPDHTQHMEPLGSPRHLAAIRAADANVGRIAEVIASSPEHRDTLLIVASDHGHETIGEIVPLEQMLLEAGLKDAPDSSDVVVASNGLSAFVYVAEAYRFRIPEIARLLEADERIGEVYTGAALAELGHRTDTALSIAVTGHYSARPNDFGIEGVAHAFEDPLSYDARPGCGQHGGLGPHEQHPFMVVRGVDFPAATTEQAETSAVDIAPTILRHLGLKVERMDGRPLQPGAD